MTVLKRLVCFLSVLFMMTGAVLFAAAEGNVCFVSIRDSFASDGNDGKTPQRPKKNFGTLGGNGAVAAVKGGGSIVASGKLYVPETYTLPDVGGKLTICASYGEKNYMDTLHPNDPSTGVLKIYPGATFRLCGDVTIDNIIIFQEYAQSVIRVASGATVEIGAGVQCYKTKDYYMALEVEEGGTLILNGGLFSSITGKGTVIDNRSKEAKEISGSLSSDPTDMAMWKDNDTYEYRLPQREPASVYTYPKDEKINGKEADTGEWQEGENSAGKTQTFWVTFGGCVIILSVVAVIFVYLGEKQKEKGER